jgi:hypothetical protein
MEQIARIEGSRSLSHEILWDFADRLPQVIAIESLSPNLYVRKDLWDLRLMAAIG